MEGKKDARLALCAHSLIPKSLPHFFFRMVQLPRANRETLKMLMQHLHMVAQNAEVNKMTVCDCLCMLLSRYRNR